MTSSPRGSAVAAAFAANWSTIVARLARKYGDLTVAEECAAEAFAHAVEQWNTDVPSDPAAWLWTVANRRAIDRIRHNARFATYAPLLTEPDRLQDLTDISPANGPEDDYLALLFGMCHPCLSTDSQIALTLRCLSGLSTQQIADVFLVSPDTMTRRLTRARTKLAANAVPFRIPEPQQWAERVDPVLNVIYLTFTAGHTTRNGATYIRGDLCDEARWLARLVESIAPQDPEVLGLAALLDFTDARRPARLNDDGELVLLIDQDRTIWDVALIKSGQRRITEAFRHKRPGRFQIQAALAACHTLSPSWEDTDWNSIVTWYGALLAIEDTPIHRLNRAVAITCMGDPHDALRELDAVREPLIEYHYFWVALADANEKIGNVAGAIEDLQRAIDLGPPNNEYSSLVKRLRKLRCESS